ncbi:MAG: Maf family protein [Planctomycetota bacterium]|nr:Maf family protein [Planctomycetota bacterium]
MTWPTPIILASGSERRRQLLTAGGWDVFVQPAHVDDSELNSRDIPARAWVAAMAWLKARSVMLQERPVELAMGTILAADTVCDLDGEIIGQPPTRESAQNMINRFRNRSHRVITGVCLVRPDASRRQIFTDTATVTLGDLTDEKIMAYLQTEEWRGKAGGYNLIERLADGWPLEWIGDESTIVGLPMRRLKPMLMPTTQMENPS